jgi:hypothetical protein
LSDNLKSRANLFITNQQEQEEPNDSEVEPNEDYQQQNPKTNKEISNKTMEPTSSTELQAHATSADEEAVNKVAEKIETLRLGPRQVRKQRQPLGQSLSCCFDRSTKPTNQQQLHNAQSHSPKT